MAVIILTEQASTPSTPSTGDWKIYPKSSGWYSLDDAGNETAIGGIPDAASDGNYYGRRNGAWTNLKTYFDSLYAALTGDQTIAGVKTFSSFPVTPSSAPTTNYEVANKKYVDDNAGGGGDYLSTLVNTEVSITGATTANWGKQHVVTGSTNYTITLQTCSGNTGKFMSFRILNSGITTLDGNSSETIEGATTIPCYQGQTITLYSDGTNAHVINQNAGNLQLWFSPLQFSSNFTQKYTVRTSQPYNFAMEQNLGAANGDWISVMFFAKKGTYTVAVLGFTAGSCAKQDWSLNGVNQTTGQDWYSASAVYNVVKTFTMTVPYTGIHTLKSTINGRNASASGWDFQVTAIAF